MYFGPRGQLVGNSWATRGHCLPWSSTPCGPSGRRFSVSLTGIGAIWGVVSEMVSTLCLLFARSHQPIVVRRVADEGSRSGRFVVREPSQALRAHRLGRSPGGQGRRVSQGADRGPGVVRRRAPPDQLIDSATDSSVGRDVLQCCIKGRQVKIRVSPTGGGTGSSGGGRLVVR